MALRQKKLVQVIKDLDIGALGGGAERFAIDLGIALQDQGWDVEFFVFFKTGTEAEKKWTGKLESQGMRVSFGAEWKGYNHPKAFLEAVRIFLAHMKVVKPQVIHSHFQLGTVAAIWWKRKSADTVVVRTAHLASEWERGLIGSLKAGYAKKLYGRLLDAEIGVSKTITRKLQEEGAATQRVRRGYIPNGINLTIKEPNEMRNPITEGLVLGTVGRLTEQKGYDDLIAALPRVFEQFPHARLYLIGDGHLKEALQEQAAGLGIERKLTFTGLIDNVQDYYQKMDLFISSSLWEGLPTVIMEAMAAGVPVVTTDIAGSNDLVEEHVSGWLAKPSDPESLASAIITACQSPAERQAYAHKGLEIARQYSMVEIAKKYSDLYLSILK